MHVRRYQTLKALASSFRLRESLESRNHVRGALLELWSSTQSSSKLESMVLDSHAGIKACAKTSMTQRSLQDFAYGLRVQRN